MLKIWSNLSCHYKLFYIERHYQDIFIVTRLTTLQKISVSYIKKQLFHASVTFTLVAGGYVEIGSELASERFSFQAFAYLISDHETWEDHEMHLR